MSVLNLAANTKYSFDTRDSIVGNQWSSTSISSNDIFAEVSNALSASADQELSDNLTNDKTNHLFENENDYSTTQISLSFSSRYLAVIIQSTSKTSQESDAYLRIYDLSSFLTTESFDDQNNHSSYLDFTDLPAMDLPHSDLLASVPFLGI